MSEDTNELNGAGLISFQVQPDRSGASSLEIVNNEFMGGDIGRLTIAVTNARNTN